LLPDSEGDKTSGGGAVKWGKKTRYSPERENPPQT